VRDTGSSTLRLRILKVSWHKVSSSVSGDGSLTNHGSFNYDSTISFSLSDQVFNGSWIWVPRVGLETRTVSLSAKAPYLKSVDLLSSNTRLNSATTNGGSKLHWKKITETLSNMADLGNNVGIVPVRVTAKVWDVGQIT
jgi:hypothetical protein